MTIMHVQKHTLLKYGTAFLLCSGLTFGTSFAADFGGDCCADLEERVAELEATAARKGNKRVSLKLSGHVHVGLLVWDDGGDTDVFIVDNGNANTRFRFKGNAKIQSGYTAGFEIEFDVDGHANSNGVSNNGSQVDELFDAPTRATQDAAGDDCGGGPGCGEQSDILELRKAELFIKTPYGKVSLGQGKTASDDTAHVDLSGTKLVSQVNHIQTIGQEFTFRRADGTLTSVTKGNVVSNIDGLSRDNRIRYDSPSIANFIFSSSFGEDDQWDVALRYKNKYKDFRVAGAIAYGERQDNSAPGAATEREVLDGSVSLRHVPTGLSFTFAAGDFDDNAGARSTINQTFYYGKAGIVRKINSLGSTAFSVSYGLGDEFFVGETGASSGLGIQDAEYEHVGIQVLQKIDAAAMDLYFGWYNDSFDAPGVTGLENLEDINLFLVGSRVRF